MLPPILGGILLGEKVQAIDHLQQQVSDRVAKAHSQRDGPDRRFTDAGKSVRTRASVNSRPLGYASNLR